MQLKCLVLMVAACLSQGWAFDASYTFDRAIVQILTRTRGANRDMDTFQKCFKYYTGQMDQAQKRYEVKYQECVSSAEAARAAADATTVKQRQDLYSQISGSCSNADVCQKEGQAVAEFNCISNESATMSRKLTEISNEATLQRKELEKQYQLVVHNRDVCAKLNQDVLQEQTNDILEDWDRCNAGLITIPPPEGSTATPSA